MIFALIISDPPSLLDCLKGSEAVGGGVGTSSAGGEDAEAAL
jgi:hypothetical protein